MFGRPAFGRHWTPADDERLRVLKSEGRSPVDIAPMLGRSSQTVAERLTYLGWIGRG